MPLFSSMDNHSASIRRNRAMIVVGILILALTSGATDYPLGTDVVPQHVIDQIDARREANIRHQRHIAEREAAMWQQIVETMAAEIGIKDTELAETVAQAVEDASSEFDLDPWLLCSLIRVESGGNPTAVSHVGAIGLTQIMPATGHEIARELGIANYSTDMLNDPALNVRMGASYLRKLLDRFDGSLHAALAAYNWGPGTISKRIRNRETLPVQYPGKILKSIPEQPEWVVVKLARS